RISFWNAEATSSKGYCPLISFLGSGVWPSSPNSPPCVPFTGRPGPLGSTCPSPFFPALPTGVLVNERQRLGERVLLQLGVAAEEHRRCPRLGHLAGLQQRVVVVGPLGHRVVGRPGGATNAGQSV